MTNGRALRAAQRVEAAQPRYLTIFQVLRERIEGGVHPLGSLIPTEVELCEAFDASRFTVREALRRLSEAGMVERRKGSGTFVTALAPRAGFVHSMHSLSELFQYALGTVFRIHAVSLVTIDAETAGLIGGDPDSRWLRIDGLRRVSEEGEPICYTIVHVDAAFAPLLPDVRELKTPIYAAVEERSGETIAEAVQEISGATLAPAVAQALSQSPGSGALLVSRRYLDRDGRTLLCSLNWHPADRFRYTMRLQRGELSS